MELVTLQQLWEEALGELTRERLEGQAPETLQAWQYAYLERLRRLPRELPWETLLETIRPLDWARAEPYNHNATLARHCLLFLFSLLERLGDEELRWHRHFLRQYLDQYAQVRRLQGLVTDLALFQQDTVAGILLYGDDFTSPDRIDTLKKRDLPPAYYDAELRAITLPLDVPVVPQVSSIALNAASNGQAGNNHQLGVRERHADPQVMVDGQLDTWFEYERLSLQPLSAPLVLDCTLTLAQETPVNRLRLVFNNLGQPQWPKLKDLLHSMNGKDYTSLRSLMGWPLEGPVDLEAILSRNGGVLSLTFQPTLLRHLRLILEQSSYYPIATPSGTRLRYAIALREIQLLGQTYLPAAEFISRPFALSRPLDRVLLETTEFHPQPQGLCRLRHFLSHDGESWTEVQPAQGLDPQLPKILSLAAQRTSQIYYRAILERQQHSQGDKLQLHRLETITEFLQFPHLPPFQLFLSQVPEVGSVAVFLPLAGSRGRESRTPLGSSDGTPRQRFTVPFPLTGEEEIWVGKQRWHYTPHLQKENGSAQVYSTNPAERLIIFGDDTHGAIPPAGLRLSLALPPQRLLCRYGTHVQAQLTHACLPEAGRLRLYRYEAPTEMPLEQLPRGASVIQLRHAPLTEDPVTFTGDTSSLKREVPYWDGSTELAQAGDYSLDRRRGRLYLFTPTPIHRNCFISYTYLPRSEVTSDWWFVDWKTIEIRSQAFHTLKVENLSLQDQAGNYVIQLPHTHLMEGRVRFFPTEQLTVELPYLNGLDEFTGLRFQSEEVPTGVSSFKLQFPPREGYPLKWSDTTTFQRQVPLDQPLRQVGDYQIVWETGEVYTYSVTQGGTVGYYAQQEIQQLEKSFAVDYLRGRIHLPRPLPEGLRVSYEYCHYEAEYDIAELIPPAAYALQPQSQTLQFTDLVYLEQLRQRYGSEDAVAVRYQYLAPGLLSPEAVRLSTPILQRYQLRLSFL